MSILKRRNRSNGAVALGAVGALVVGAAVVLAFRDQGYTAESVDLSQSTVWVTNNAQLLVGRLNKQVDELNSSVRVNPLFDVYQDGDTVVVMDGTKHELRPLDVVSVTLGGKIALPERAAVAMGGGVLGVADEKTGAVWVGAPAELGSLDPTSTPPTVKTAPDVAVTVSQSGTVFAVAPGSGNLWTVRSGAAPGVDGSGPDSSAAQGESSGSPSSSGSTATSSAAGPAPQALSGGPLSGREGGAASPISITAVGEVPVVLDRAAGVLRFADHSVSIPGADTAVLQQPGPTADAVVVATSAALLRIPLAGGDPQTVIDHQSGQPAAPVVLDGCTHAAWSSSPAQYGVTCGGATPTVREVPGHTGTKPMVFRTNRHTIVLNDVDTGNTWTVDTDMKLINNWTEVQPLSDTDDNTATNNGTEGDSQQTTNSRTNCSTGQVQPPSPTDDSYGVRAGRTTVLHVLDNDASSDCSMVVITGVDGCPNSTICSVEPVDDGQAIQVTVPAGATGDLPDFTYHVSDGLGHNATARVAVKIAGPDAHDPPKKLHDSDVPVETLGTVSYNVLSNYISPQGDDLYLVSASIDTGDEVTFQPNGTITYTDTGAGGAVKKTIQFLVTDGATTPVEGELTVDVQQSGAATPVASPVYATAVVGRATTVNILRNVTTTTVDATTLTAVKPIGTAAATVGAIDQTGGTVTMTGTKPGTYYFTYQVAAGAKTADGLLRVDVIPAASQPEPPIAMTDVVYLPTDGVTTVDPTVNDTDPMGTGLAVVQVRPDPGLSVTTENMQLVTVSAQSTVAAGGASISYTVSNGVGTATGSIRVVPVPAEDPVPPVAKDFQATVRAGDAITMPIAAHAYDPNGDVITLTKVTPTTDNGVLPAGSGILFHTDSAIRYLAPATAPATTLQLSYTVTNTQGASATASATINVVGDPSTTNHPPQTPAPTFARVLVNTSVGIPLPLDGIDPDGDWVTLVGLGSQTPQLGGATPSGLDSIDYSAGGMPGLDTFTYIATDPYGATVTGQVSVLVVEPPATRLSPVAPNLDVTVRPGRTVDVDVLGPASAANGSEHLSLGDPAFVAPQNWNVTTAADGAHLQVQAPQTETLGSIKYTIKDDSGLTGTGILQFKVSATAPLKPPTANDIVVAATDLKKGQKSVDVTVPDDKITNPSGSLSDLTLSLDPQAAGAATVTGPRTIHVPLTAARQVLAYVVTNPDKASATAFVVVPPAEADAPPTVAPPTQTSGAAPTTTTAAAPPLMVSPTGPPLTVDAGKTVKILVDDYVTASDGSHLIVPNGSPVTASPSGQAGRVNDKEVDYTAAKDGDGTVYVSFRVSDGKRDPVGVTLPVTVNPVIIPAPEVTPFQISVEADKSASQDVSGLVKAGNDAQQAQLHYQITGGGAGFSASMNGSVLTVQATPDAKGRSATFTLTATDGQGKSGSGPVTVIATGSQAPLAQVQPLIADGRPGQASTVNVLSAVTYNPFDKPMTVVSVKAQSGKGSVTSNGSTAIITPSAVGSVVAAFTLADATNDPSRYVTGTITVTVKDKPDAPGTPTVVSMVSKTVQLKWAVPQANGSPITGYVVSGGPKPQQCNAPPCTINGLTNGTPYKFTVVAVNAIGNSKPSSPSAPVTPDTAPNTPAAPVLTWIGTSALQVNWKDPGSTGTPVTSYDLRISPKDENGQTEVDGLTDTSYTWKNLKDGTAYTFKVIAHNSSKTPSGWSSSSAAETPSGPAGAPTDVTVTFGPDNYNPGGNTLSVSWTAPADDGGAAVTSYQVKYTSSAGGDTITVQAPTTSTTIQGVQDGVEYSVSVVAVNLSGPGATSGTSSATPYSPPGAVTGLSANATGQNGQVNVTWSAAQSHGRSIDHYQLSWNGGSTTTSNTSYAVSGLSNGQGYTFSVQACYANVDFNTCGTSATASATPYGPVGTPSVSACNANQNQVQFCWSIPGDNGRGPITTEISIDGGGWSANNSGNIWVGSGCAQGHSIQVRAHDSAGLYGGASGASGSSQACPTVTLSEGASYYNATTCNVSACHYVYVTLSHFAANATVTCDKPWTGGVTTTLTTDGNGSAGKQSGNFYGYSGTTISFTCGGVTGSYNWP